jgi:putative addiction module component (TIGR02574 family)
MGALLDQIIRELDQLTREERLSLAGLILEMDDPPADEAWRNEIQARIDAIDDGLEKGVSYEEVMLAAERILEP